MSNENRTLPNQQFYGGQSSDEAIGTPASFSYSRALEHRRNPSQLSVLPGPRRLNDGVVQDLILNIQQVRSGNRYAYGDTGCIYKIDTSNTLTYLNKLPSGSDGMLYRQDNEKIYFATQTDIQRLSATAAAPTIDQIYGPSKSIDTNAYRTNGAATYSVPTVIDENQSCYFQPDIEPFYSIKFKIVTKGTGSVTLTLHDGLNNVLATVVISNASLQVGMNEAIFSSQIRGLVKPNARTYHWHVTSTVADTVIQSTTANQLNTADFELWAYRLVDTVNGYHPMAQFQQFTLIGNGNYLAVWEPLTDTDPPNNEFQRHRLVFPVGYEVCGVDVTDEYAIIACAKYALDGSKDFQEGKIFVWDGTAQTYNFVIDVSGGAPEALRTFGNIPYMYVNGSLCAWPGGKEIIKVRTIPGMNLPYTDIVDNTHVYPNMMTIRDNMLHAGFPSVSNNPNVEYGVYIWGTFEKNYAASFNYGYVNSSLVNKNTSGFLRHGCVCNFGDEMYISVQYADNKYGVEIVDNLCDPAPVFKWRARRFSAGAAYKEKSAQKVGIDTAPLPAGVTITPTIRLDHNAEQPLTDSKMATGDFHKVAAIKQGNFRQVVIGFDGTVDPGSSSPIIECVSLEWNPYLERKGL